MALDYAADHIRVNALCPGVTATEMTLKVIENYLVADGQECLTRAFTALDARLLADAADPLVCAGWCVTGSACRPALEAMRVHVGPTAEQ